MFIIFERIINKIKKLLQNKTYLKNILIYLLMKSSSINMIKLFNYTLFLGYLVSAMPQLA